MPGGIGPVGVGQMDAAVMRVCHARKSSLVDALCRCLHLALKLITTVPHHDDDDDDGDVII